MKTFDFFCFKVLAVKIFYYFCFKVLAGKPQRVRKNTTLSLLAVACMFLQRSNFLRHFLPVHNFGSVYTAFLFRDMHFGKRTLKT